MASRDSARHATPTVNGLRHDSPGDTDSLAQALAAAAGLRAA
jgi:hypothetical protein